MPKMIVSIDGVVIKEVQLTKDRTTLGRRPYNDIVIDNLAVSGEHAVLQMTGNDVFIEDLNSTNGTYVNGKAVKKQQLQQWRHGRGRQVQDQVRQRGGQCRGFRENHDGQRRLAAWLRQPRFWPPAAVPVRRGCVGLQCAARLRRTGSLAPASIKVLSGAAAGREVPLTKVVTTIGKPGVAVAAITKRQHGFVVHHVEGAAIRRSTAHPSAPIRCRSRTVT
jgi:hypothetical protein